MSAAQLIAAVIAAFVVTQAAIFATTLFLHRGVLHRALSLPPAPAYHSHRYVNSATNLKSLALVTGGEGLHNNHHAAPTSARFSLHDGELDPAWWLVRMFVALHLVQIRHDDVHLKTAA